MMLYDKSPLFCKIYIDDGFGLWQHGLNDLLKFKDYANDTSKYISRIEMVYKEDRLFRYDR